MSVPLIRRSSVTSREGFAEGRDFVHDEPADRNDRSPLEGVQIAVPGNTGRHMQDLEGYRAFGAFAIVAFHGYQYCRALTGDYAYEGTWLQTVVFLVPHCLFFVLGGFLLYAPVVRRLQDGTPAASPKAFLFRRAVRILPLYWTVVIVVWVSRNTQLPGNWIDLLEHLTFTQVFDDVRIFYTVGPSWSLAVEVMFYGFLVLLMWILGRTRAHRLPRGARRAVQWVPVAVLTGISAWYLPWAVAQGFPDTRYSVWFSPMANAYMFAAGMALAVIAAARGGRPVRREVYWFLRAAGLALTVLGAAVRGGRYNDPQDTAIGYAWATAGAALLIAGSILAPRTSRLRRVMRASWLQWGGLISYSVYLWHEPAMIALGNLGLITNRQQDFWWVVIVLAVVSAAVGITSYWIIEYPAAQLRALRDGKGQLVDFYGAPETGYQTKALHVVRTPVGTEVEDPPRPGTGEDPVRPTRPPASA